jgi:hypothetical protein
MKSFALAVLLVVLGLALAGRAGGGRHSQPGATSVKVGRFLAVAHPLAAASGCVSVRWRLRTAAGRGQSVVEAIGRLAGHPRTVAGTPFWPMRLTQVRTPIENRAEMIANRADAKG